MEAPHDITCKPTLDTFVRLGIVLAAAFGFGLYFFYDAAIGYPKANEIYLSHRAFANLGAQATALNTTSPEAAQTWKQQRETTPLIAARRRQDGILCAAGLKLLTPLPPDCPAAQSCPPETHDLAAMQTSWNQCWQDYTQRMGYPIKPAEHLYNDLNIFEQRIAGWVCMGISVLLVALVLRLSRRKLALHGDQVTVGSTTFPISDITCIDLRQWGVGFKGVAYFTVNGKKLRVDGMTYGGFSRKNGQPAETFMQGVLSQYHGDIIDYEQSNQKDD